MDVIADRLSELGHDCGIADVPALGGHGHQEVVPHQPRDEPGVVFAESVQGAELGDQVGAQLGMVASAAFRDVVEQSRDVEKLRFGQPCEYVRAVREFMVTSRVGEHPQVADHEQAVLVDGIDVEQVVLHLSRHPIEDREIGAEDSVAMHPAQLVVDAARLAKDLQKEAAGADVGPEPVIDPVSVRPDESDRGRPHPFDVGMLLQQQKYLQQRERMAAEDVLASDLQVTVHGLEAPVDRLDAISAADVENHLLEVPEQHLVETGQLHHLPVVALHQALHAEPLAVVLESQHLRELPLVIEQEPILRATRQYVQREPHPPQENAGPIGAHRALRW